MTTDKPDHLNCRAFLPWIVGTVGAICAVLLVMARFPGLIGREDTGTRDSFSPQEITLIQEGDVLLRKGVGMPSEVIASMLGGGLNLSHCAVVVIPDQQHIRRVPPNRVSFFSEGGQVIPGRPALIHTVNAGLSGVDGVQIQDLDHFNKYSSKDSLVVLRPVMSNAERGRMVQLAWDRLGRGIPFDNQYDLKDPSRLYCSELIFNIYDEMTWTGRFSRVLTMGVFSFESFLDSEYYNLVLSHNPAVHSLAKPGVPSASSD